MFFILLLFIASGCNKPGPPDQPLGCTEDTTSHQFHWEVDTVDIFPLELIPFLSHINDVAMLNSDNIWIAGEFIARDTIQSTETLSFNLIHFNGNRYIAYNIPANYRDIDEGYVPARTILAFNEDDIWITFYSGAYAHWDGQEWTCEYLWELEGTPNDMWGLSSSYFYIVGANGSITYYDGTSFMAQSSGITTPLTHIFGLDQDNIWTVSYYNGAGGIQNELLKYNEGSWEEIHHQDSWMENWPPSDYTRPSGIYRTTWVNQDTLYLGCSSLWVESLSTGEGYLKTLPQLDWELYYGFGHITGNHCNDIFAFMVTGLGMTHFNGINWQRDDILMSLDTDRSIIIEDVAVFDNEVSIIGHDHFSRHLLLVKGKR